MDRVIITGSKGLIGSELTKVMKEKYRLVELSKSLGHDFTDENFVCEYFTIGNI